MVGFLTADTPREVFAADTWGAQYLGVTKKDLLLATRVLVAKRMLTPSEDFEHASPTEKLLAQQSAEKQQDGLGAKQKPSLLNLPNKIHSCPPNLLFEDGTKNPNGYRESTPVRSPKLVSCSCHSATLELRAFRTALRL
jgi:hypothetical protein